MSILRFSHPHANCDNLKILIVANQNTMSDQEVQVLGSCRMSHAIISWTECDLSFHLHILFSVAL